MKKPHSSRNKSHRAERAVISAQHKAMSHEPWDLRAIKLQLVHPEWFSNCLHYRQADHEWRTNTAIHFSNMQRLGILKSIDFGMLTPYRITLFLRACRSYQRQCDKERSKRVEHSPQDPPQASDAAKPLGLHCNEVAYFGDAGGSTARFTGDPRQIEHQMVLAESGPILRGAQESDRV